MKARISNESGFTRIYLDDVEIHRVVSVDFHESVESRPTLVLEIRPEEIEFELDGVDVTKKVLESKKMEDGYRDFVRFLFRGKAEANGIRIVDSRNNG